MAGQAEYYAALVTEIEAALQATEFPPSLMEQLARMPREVFDNIVGHLTIPKQADLARASAVMYTQVRPVMDGFVWENAPLPLPEMTADGRLPWPYLKQAEAAAAGTELVACPWCNVLHHPLRALDKGDAAFPCARQVHIGHDGNTFWILTGLDNRPAKWHPLLLYAFSVWSQRGLDTTRLVDAGDLNYACEKLDVGDTVPMTRDQWKLKWVPGRGLFARWRQSEMVVADDDWEVWFEACCACQEVRRSFNTVRLNAGRFDLRASQMHRGWYDDHGVFQRTDVPMLTGPYRPLMTSPVDGCGRCGMDYEWAWQEADAGEYGAGHWLHFTTWFHVGGGGGRDVDIKAIHDSMQKGRGHWHDYPNPSPPGCAPLAVGQVAALSNFPVDY